MSESRLACGKQSPLDARLRTAQVPRRCSITKHGCNKKYYVHDSEPADISGRIGRLCPHNARLSKHQRGNKWPSTHTKKYFNYRPRLRSLCYFARASPSCMKASIKVSLVMVVDVRLGNVADRPSWRRALVLVLTAVWVTTQKLGQGSEGVRGAGGERQKTLCGAVMVSAFVLFCF